MIPLSATQGYATLLSRVSGSAVRDLDKLMASAAGESLKVQQEAVMDVLPLLGEEYAGASSLVSAEFFTELQAMNEVAKPVAAETLSGAGTKRWQALAGWGTSSSVFEQGGMQLAFSLLSGGLTKVLTEIAADTIVGNAALQGSMRAQRVPQSGCCAFCGMLASRGAVYSSVESASVVGGRGKPVGSHRLAKGIRPRGARKLGETFHDHCRCRVVAVSGSNQVELQSDADKYLDSYNEAFKKANSGLELNTLSFMDEAGNRHNEYEWVSAGGDIISPKKRQAMIIAAMRHDLGVK